MNKTFNHLTKTAFAILMSAGFLVSCGKPAAEENKEVAGSEGLSYVLNDEGTAYTFANLGTCTTADVVIGNTYKGLPVTAIGEGACRDDADAGDFKVTVNSITVSNGITDIAFRGLQNWNVKKVILGDEVPSLGKAALRKNTKMEKVVLGKGLKTIGLDAFSALDDLASLTVYYKGSEADWKNVTIETGNDFLTSDKCTISYNYTGNGTEL